MVLHCHRCSSALEEDTGFCPQCAAPQLQVAPAEETAETHSAAGRPGQGASQPFPRDRRSVDWRSIFRLALWIAIPVGILTIPLYFLPVILAGLFFFPLILSGLLMVIRRYQGRRPGATLDGRSGFRIGALTGLLVAYISAFGVAGWRLVERFQFHQGALMDSDYAQAMQQSSMAAQSMAQSSQSGADQARVLLNFMLTPDGRAGMTLFSTAVTAAGTVLLAGLGGMLGARIVSRRMQQ